MSEEEARRILGEAARGDLLCGRTIFGEQVLVQGRSSQSVAHLDGIYTAAELEAVLWWMRNT